jgi:hypothetical protein
MADANSRTTRNTRRSRRSGKRNAESSAVGMKPQAQPPNARPTIMNQPIKASAPLSPELLRGELERILAVESAARERRQAEVDAAIEREAREGITLKGKRLEQARRIVGDVILSAASVYQLAGAIGEANEEEAGRLMTALECAAKVIAREGDVLDALLRNSSRGSFGNFEDDFTPLTEEEAARIEAEEAAGE